MNIEEFINYWDKTIKEWSDSGGDIPESEQVWFEGKSKLYEWSKLMPEPYWGDPSNCSVAILNYNPYCIPEIDESCDGSIENKDDKTTVCGLMADNYSDIAKSFPILDRHLKCPYKCFGGVGWWKRKEKWLNQIISSYKPEILNYDLKPFALELCGWHSPEWKFVKINKNTRKNILERVIPVFKEAISNSKLKFGLCIGKGLGNILLQLTNRDGDKNIYNDKIISMLYKELDPKIQEKDRNYRVLDLGDGALVLNTYGGRNTSPSPYFAKFEKNLIETIKYNQNEEL